MKPLILLHGALGTSEQLGPLSEKLDVDQPVHRLNFEGHGSGVQPDRPFRMEYFAENVLKYMDENEIGQADLYGYSMGGYVALYIALHHPERVGKISTLGTVLKWSPEVAEREVKFLNPEKILEKVPKFATELNRRHPEVWEEVALKTKDLLSDLGKTPRIKDDEWSDIDHKVRIHVGDRDETAGIQQSMEVYRELEDGEFVVLPNSPHPIEQVDMDLLVASLNGFFG
jgi:pimeloyl-ACP methyl ester carboxylesterase